MIAGKKVCQQTLCHHFRDCPFALDMTKCRHALSIETPLREIEKIN